MAEKTRTVLIDGYQARRGDEAVRNRDSGQFLGPKGASRPDKGSFSDPRPPKTVSVVNPPKPGQK